MAQVKYKEDCKKETGSSLYHLLPETAETHFAKEMSEIQSEVMSTFFAQHFYDCLFFLFLFTVQFYLLQVRYRKDREDLSDTLYSLLPETLQTQFVKDMAETHSEVRTGINWEEKFVGLVDKSQERHN